MGHHLPPGVDTQKDSLILQAPRKYWPSKALEWAFWRLPACVFVGDDAELRCTFFERCHRL